MDKLTVYYQNVCGLNDPKKCKGFLENVKKNDYDVICLTETFLQDPFTETLFDDRYEVFRGDRRKKEKRGGVLIAVKKTLNPKEEKGWRHQESLVEDTWVTITKDENKVHLYCVYISSRRIDADRQSHQEEVSNTLKTYKMHSGKIIITGDFNEPHIKWTNEGNPSDLKASGRSRTLLSVLIEPNKLKQSCGIPNAKNRTLDLVLSNTDLITSKPAEPLVAEPDHHAAILIKFKSNNQHITSKL